MASGNVPGIAFLIAKDGKILDEGYYGKANLEVDAEVTKKSVFAIASMSKTYTGSHFNDGRERIATLRRFYQEVHPGSS